MNGFDLSTAQDIRLGSTTVSAVYLGNTLVWPTGPHDYSQDYFTLEVIDNGTLQFYTHGRVNGSEDRITLQYRVGNSNWTSVTETPYDQSDPYGDQYINFGNVSVGDKIEFKHTGTMRIGSGIAQYRTWQGSCRCRAYGNIMSLLYGDSFVNQNEIISWREFYMFFYGSAVTRIGHLVLPATVLKDYCYAYMFDNCYIETMPILPAPVLVESCYQNMFYDCTSLNSITCYATDISATNCLSNWLYNVSPTGTFYKDSNTTYPTGTSGIPSGWTVVNI